MLGLHCCSGVSRCGERGLLFIAVRRLLIMVASLVAVHRPYRAGSVLAYGLSCPQGMWKLPRSGIDPLSPALAGGFFPTWAIREVLFFFNLKVELQSVGCLCVSQPLKSSESSCMEEGKAQWCRNSSA